MLYSSAVVFCITSLSYYQLLWTDIKLNFISFAHAPVEPSAFHSFIKLICLPFSAPSTFVCISGVCVCVCDCCNCKITWQSINVSSCSSGRNPTLDCLCLPIGFRGLPIPRRNIVRLSAGNQLMMVCLIRPPRMFASLGTWLLQPAFNGFDSNCVACQRAICILKSAHIFCGTLATVMMMKMTPMIQLMVNGEWRMVNHDDNVAPPEALLTIAIYQLRWTPHNCIKGHLGTF